MIHFCRQGTSPRRGTIVLIFILLNGLLLSGCASKSHGIDQNQTQLPVIQNIETDLNNLITDLEKNMPRANTEGFTIPGRSDQDAFKKITIAIEDNTPDLFTETASAFNYEILKVSDQGNFETQSYVLHEKLPITKAWGLYIFRIKTGKNIIVEAPHPLADKDTPRVALDLYRALQAQALLVAGAHRNANLDGSADSAHALKSIFQTVHQTLFQLSKKANGTTIFIQIHGFAANEHPNYPQVVIGHNWKNNSEKDKLLQKIADALHGNNITFGICNGKTYLDLCGTENIQSIATSGGIFIHMELDETLRKNDSALITSLKQVFTP